MGCCNPNVWIVKPKVCMGGVFEGKCGLLQLKCVVAEAQILYGWGV